MTLDGAGPMTAALSDVADVQWGAGGVVREVSQTFSLVHSVRGGTAGPLIISLGALNRRVSLESS